MILVDTSVWVDHFRNTNDTLIRLLQSDFVLMHPMILAEIACGTPPAPRQRTLSDLDLLPKSHQATITEVLTFIENEKLFGLGCGLVDITLLASTRITPGAKIWTLDKRLSRLAERLNVGFQPIH
ncbi:type II toxin-antitoxin system VapC family toxin [Escherichia coli]|uniref:type II toxin-antitoxin system VapC family toxin n=1 Tax=Escherichia coli TaxID=562 RepID=UPI000FA451D7|nr:PIN domain-containing protein [Escherichia coli]EAA6862000.1 type II toxin-antitoxin system VapC family toxin [Salmonella enterica subsp. enterica serovar Johannesburg]EJF7176973.1 PIN domain-containing protein [Salmonella enterica]EER5239166.1 PIN domain-containing protein [Escherichia coli]EFC4005657.1 PIN domain-containing protein [Escherichia coli]EFU6029424.1 PIN domain-containing protein [Escherichia coli]